jgi:hypothetical protein
VLWLALVFTLAPALGDAVADRSRAVQLTVTTAAWVVWAAVLITGAIASTVTLTIVRTLAPAAPLAALLAWFTGASSTGAVVGLTTAAAAAALAFGADLGQVFVQASAYGDERRFPLRPPATLLLAVPLLWGVIAVGLGCGVLLLATGQILIGAPLAVLASGLAWFSAPRLHGLARRWFVLVPAGVVLHDRLVLAETAMFARADVARAALALEGTQAADLTGAALGNPVELSLNRTADVVLAGGTHARDVRAVLFSPTRPGRVLAALSG